MVENELRQRERLDTNEDQIFSDGNRSPESSDEDDARPRIDNFMVVEESKRNNNQRYSAGLGSTANAFKSQDTVKNQAAGAGNFRSLQGNAMPQAFIAAGHNDSLSLRNNPVGAKKGNQRLKPNQQDEKIDLDDDEDMHEETGTPMRVSHGYPGGRMAARKNSENIYESPSGDNGKSPMLSVANSELDIVLQSSGQPDQPKGRTAAASGHANKAFEKSVLKLNM